MPSLAAILASLPTPACAKIASMLAAACLPTSPPSHAPAPPALPESEPSPNLPRYSPMPPPPILPADLAPERESSSGFGPP